MRALAFRSSTTDALRRAIASGCAVLVLALTFFAASPGAHDWMHGGESAASRASTDASQPMDEAVADHCAVVLFASGVDLPVGPVALIPPRTLVQRVSAATAAEFDLVSPRYLRRPERGPPLRLN